MVPAKEKYLFLGIDRGLSTKEALDILTELREGMLLGKLSQVEEYFFIEATGVVLNDKTAELSLEEWRQIVEYFYMYSSSAELVREEDKSGVRSKILEVLSTSNNGFTEKGLGHGCLDHANVQIGFKRRRK